MAGEVVSVGEDVKSWKIGDRVSANFSLEHFHGDLSRAALSTQLGGSIHGVLTEYKTFPQN
ncbi:hypothetical protein H0H93_015049, partial [Arthromyces matolae]